MSFDHLSHHRNDLLQCDDGATVLIVLKTWDGGEVVEATISTTEVLDYIKTINREIPLEAEIETFLTTTTTTITTTIVVGIIDGL